MNTIFFDFAITGTIICVGAAGIIIQLMAREVNLKRDPGDPLLLFGGPSLRTDKLRQEYRRLYPDGKLNRYLAILYAALLICLVLLAMSLLPADWFAA